MRRRRRRIMTKERLFWNCWKRPGFRWWGGILGLWRNSINLRCVVRMDCHYFLFLLKNCCPIQITKKDENRLFYSVNDWLLTIQWSDQLVQKNWNIFLTGRWKRCHWLRWLDRAFWFQSFDRWLRMGLDLRRSRSLLLGKRVVNWKTIE